MCLLNCTSGITSGAESGTTASSPVFATLPSMRSSASKICEYSMTVTLTRMSAVKCNGVGQVSFNALGGHGRKQTADKENFFNAKCMSLITLLRTGGSPNELRTHRMAD